MGKVKLMEPLGVDFVVNSKQMTKQEEEEVKAFIVADKQKRKAEAGKKTGEGGPRLKKRVFVSKDIERRD